MCAQKKHGDARTFSADLGRGLAGALIFAAPLHMTMEVWEHGVVLGGARMAVLVAATLPLLFGLSVHTGFEPNEHRWQDVLDACIAFGMGLLASALMLALFGVLDGSLALGGVVSTLALSAVPASIGAIVANKQLGVRRGRDHGGDEDEHPGYAQELFLMAAGALYLSIQVAPTEEIMLIAHRMSSWHAVLLVLVSLVALHVLVYQVGFAGQEEPPGYAGFALTFLHFTVAGYGVALAIAGLQVWAFRHGAGASIAETVKMSVVLGFPASLGAATARLLV